MASTGHFNVNRLFNVKGWTCVVTGGGTGIGLMATQALAANGAKVYIIGPDQAQLDGIAAIYNEGASHDEARGMLIGIQRDIRYKVRSSIDPSEPA